MCTTMTLGVRAPTVVLYSGITIALCVKKYSLPTQDDKYPCPATVPAVTGIDRPKLGQRRSSGLHTTDEARTALRLSKLRSIKILYTLTMIYDSLYI